MSIGVFDSGVGGLTVHHRLVERFPDADFIYLADQANAPYGGRPGEEIVELTKAGCIRLFDEGCDLVVLACNTASGIALRRLQQTWLPGYRKQVGRPVNILGIIVPTIEAATGLPWEHEADRRGDKIEKLAFEAAGFFEVQIEKNLVLLTIRHYNEEILQKMITGHTIELRQQSPETVQVLLKK